MKLLFLFISTFLVRFALAQNEEKIKINQVGFYPAEDKIAIITEKESPNNFYVVSIPSNEIVFKGQLGKLIASKNSSTFTRVADFSSLKTPGAYQLIVEGVGKSYPFQIKSKVLEPVVKT